MFKQQNVLDLLQNFLQSINKPVYHTPSMFLIFVVNFQDDMLANLFVNCELELANCIDLLSIILN
jgi:hypothetical protein